MENQENKNLTTETNITEDSRTYKITDKGIAIPTETWKDIKKQKERPEDKNEHNEDYTVISINQEVNENTSELNYEETEEVKTVQKVGVIILMLFITYLCVFVWHEKYTIRTSLIEEVEEFIESLENGDLIEDATD